MRAPWQVAGVDYAVGINAGTVLKNPTTMSMAGVSVDKSNHIVYVTGNNVVLDGWNLGLERSSTGAEYNCHQQRFYAGILQYEAGSVGGTVEYYKVDQAGPARTLRLHGLGSGTFVVEYNDFENAYHMHAQFTYGNGRASRSYSSIICLQNAGSGSAAGAHGDFIQIFGDSHAQRCSNQLQHGYSKQSGYITQGWSIGYDRQTI